MKVITHKFYQCEICGKEYVDREDALSCESRPKSEDKGAKVGDIVLITNGDGSGKLAKVVRVGIHDKLREHYAWERYWHTVFVVADVLTRGGGSRLLSFDSYELHR